MNKQNATSSTSKSAYFVLRLAVSIFLKIHEQSLVAKITVLDNVCCLETFYFKVNEYFSICIVYIQLYSPTSFFIYLIFTVIH